MKEVIELETYLEGESHTFAFYGQLVDHSIVFYSEVFRQK